MNFNNQSETYSGEVVDTVVVRGALSWKQQSKRASKRASNVAQHSAREAVFINKVYSVECGCGGIIPCDGLERVLDY